MREGHLQSASSSTGAPVPTKHSVGCRRTRRTGGWSTTRNRTRDFGTGNITHLTSSYALPYLAPSRMSLAFPAQLPVGYGTYWPVFTASPPTSDWPLAAAKKKRTWRHNRRSRRRSRTYDAQGQPRTSRWVPGVFSQGADGVNKPDNLIVYLSRSSPDTARRRYLAPRRVCSKGYITGE